MPDSPIPTPPEPAAAGANGSAEPPPAWTEGMLANPHAVGDKAQRVQRMFGAIARSYDLNNRLHSLGMDQHWRNVAVRMVGVKAGDRIVDVACGTGDLTVKLYLAAWHARQRGHTRELLFPDAGQVMGLDFTAEMLAIAAKKDLSFHAPREIWTTWQAEAKQRIKYVQGDAMALPLGDGAVDVVTIAFGIRNVADWGKAIGEFARVLKPGGRLVILEFSLPRNRVLRGLYNFYFRRVLPRTATWISGDTTGAYKYLPESVNTFISREAMVERMGAAGFAGIEARALTLGVCVCYKGVRNGKS
jgi:demethylmenaquinone methyltransferase / 2-methoxy-6-polyprenyl-1,4-benzoquinol methylase